MIINNVTLTGYSISGLVTSKTFNLGNLSFQPTTTDRSARHS